MRKYGVPVILIEAAYTEAGFDANALQPDAALPIYAEQRPARVSISDAVSARAAR